MNGVGREGPVVAGRLPLPQGLHEANLALLEPQLDPRSHEGVVLAALPFDARLPHQDAQSARFVEQERIGTRGKIAPVHGHLAPCPDTVVALETDAAAPYDVRPARVGCPSVLHGGPGVGGALAWVAHTAP